MIMKCPNKLINSDAVLIGYNVAVLLYDFPDFIKIFHILPPYQLLDQSVFLVIDIHFFAVFEFHIRIRQSLTNVPYSPYFSRT